MTKKNSSIKFNYAVGRYWEGSSGAVGCYASGSEVFFGTLKEAKEFREYCNKQSEQEKDYKIFMLVEVPV